MSQKGHFGALRPTVEPECPTVGRGVVSPKG